MCPRSSRQPTSDELVENFNQCLTLIRICPLTAAAAATLPSTALAHKGRVEGKPPRISEWLAPLPIAWILSLSRILIGCRRIGVVGAAIGVASSVPASRARR